MRTDDFDRHIMEELSQIPPAELPRFTPWAPRYGPYRSGNGPAHFPVPVLLSAISPPAAGRCPSVSGLPLPSALRTAGSVSAGLLSALLLASHMALDVLAATPVMAMLAASPAVDGTLTWLLQGASLLCCWPCGGGPGRLSLLRDRKSAP